MDTPLTILFIGIVIGIVIGSSLRIPKPNKLRLKMAYTFTNINVVPLSITGAVDAEGADAQFDTNNVASVTWGVENANGSDIGTVTQSDTDPLAASYNAGVAGAEGYVTCAVTFNDGKVLDGKSDLIKLTSSEAVSFKIGFGDPA